MDQWAVLVPNTVMKRPMENLSLSRYTVQLLEMILIPGKCMGVGVGDVNAQRVLTGTEGKWSRSFTSPKSCVVTLLKVEGTSPQILSGGQQWRCGRPRGAASHIMRQQQGGWGRAWVTPTPLLSKHDGKWALPGKADVCIYIHIYNCHKFFQGLRRTVLDVPIGDDIQQAFPPKTHTIKKWSEHK